MKNFMCLNCGTINPYNKELLCHACGEQTEKAFYKSLLNISNDSVRYGYQYRMMYERQLQVAGSIKGKPSLLAPSDYFDFLAAAVLAGVAGNFVYDIIKAIGVKIADALAHKNKLSSSEKELLSLIADEKSLKKFIKYITDYARDLKSAKKEIKEAIEEEIQADIYGKLHKSMMKAIKSKDKKEMKLFLEKVNREKKKKKQRPAIKGLEKILKQLRDT